MNAFFVIILVALVLEFVLGLVADLMNLRSLRSDPPAELKGVYEGEEYRRSQEYTRVTTRFEIVTGAVKLALLRVELFGLACVHQLRGEEYVVAEVLFTGNYLREMKRLEVWEAAAEHNKAVLAATERIEPRLEARAGLLTSWVGRGIVQKCAERAVNRQGSEESWGRGITADLLAETFQLRVGRSLNLAGAERLRSTVLKLHGQSLDAITRVKVLAEERL